MSKKRRTFSAAFKAKIAMEALKEQEPINRIASRYKVLPTQVSAWKSHLLKRLPETFAMDNKHSRSETDWEEQEGKITVKRQCELLGLARSTGYYRPRGESAENLALMRRLDGIYTDHPFYGVRQMRRVLKREGQRVNPKRIRRLMRLMGFEAQCPKPNLSKPAPGPIRPGVRISPTSASKGALSIWLRSWTGSAERSSPGSYPTP